MDRRTFIAATTFAAAANVLAEEGDMLEDDATLVIDGIRIPGRLAQPRDGASACVLILAGSLFSNVDGDYPSWNIRPHAYRDLAHQLAARGVASMRQAKVGPGTGSETLDPGQAAAHRHFTQRIVVAQAALAHTCQSLPGARLFVAGHSEGAVVASLLAADAGATLEGVISLSGPAHRLLDIMRIQVSAQPGAALALFDAALVDIRHGRPLSDAARVHPSLSGLANMGPEALLYLREADAVDPCAAIARVRQSMLLVQGGRDFSVTPEQVDMLAAARAGLPTQIERFPELQHFYKRAAPGLDPMASFMLSDESDPAVADAIVRWIG